MAIPPRMRPMSFKQSVDTWIPRAAALLAAALLLDRIGPPGAGGRGGGARERSGALREHRRGGGLCGPSLVARTFRAGRLRRAGVLEPRGRLAPGGLRGRRPRLRRDAGRLLGAADPDRDHPRRRPRPGDLPPARLALRGPGPLPLRARRDADRPGGPRRRALRADLPAGVDVLEERAPRARARPRDAAGADGGRLHRRPRLRDELLRRPRRGGVRRRALARRSRHGQGRRDRAARVGGPVRRAAQPRVRPGDGRHPGPGARGLRSRLGRALPPGECQGRILRVCGEDVEVAYALPLPEGRERTSSTATIRSSPRPGAGRRLLGRRRLRPLPDLGWSTGAPAPARGRRRSGACASPASPRA